MTCGKAIIPRNHRQLCFRRKVAEDDEEETDAEIIDIAKTMPQNVRRIIHTIITDGTRAHQHQLPAHRRSVPATRENSMHIMERRQPWKLIAQHVLRARVATRKI